MDTLYYSPGACSLAPHIALEETGMPYRAERIAIDQGEHEAAGYLAVHPLGRVPALRTQNAVLTEASAILLHVADTHPTSRLAPPPGTMARARCHEWLSFVGTSLHPSFARILRPDRIADDGAAVEAVRAKARSVFWDLLAHADGRLSGKQFALGDDYSICDPYLLVCWLWGRFVQLPVDELGAYSATARRVLARPAVQKALADEGLPVTA